MARIITLTTDFGLRDPYQGAMKGAILSINPEAGLIDITHLIAPGNILEGAFVLFESCGFFPRGTIHLGVVDPGVGGERRPILLETEDCIFVGPDNGLFSIAAKGKVRRVIHLTKKEYFRSEVSSTFHGRDIFGPVAAHLSLGADPGVLGEETGSFNEVELPATEKRGGAIYGAVIYIDSFGNLITNISKVDALGLGGVLEAEINGFSISGLKRTYCDVKKGAPVMLIGSSDFLEIAVSSGRASTELKAKVGDKVLLRPLKR
ncbi:MAG: SAM-dependent chlorinase/fluorinase [Deltaproteobacteria bacterium]|nr:SAM-dependent chlorinase/fluorinase [Deltaproteobacteria bacterium]